MPEQLLVWKSLVVGVWLALFLVVERIVPASPWKPGNPDRHFSQFRHLAQNGSLWAINILLSPLLVIGVTAFAVSAGLLWRQQFFSSLPASLWLVFDLLALDLWIYGWHRLNHRWPLLWRFHQVHHLDEQLDASSALRFHFGEVLLSAVFRLPVIVVLAIPLSTVVIFETVVAMAAIFHHSNVLLPKMVERPLSRIIVTPAIHWIHHHAVRGDTDSNYGTILSVWDRLFGSASNNARTPDLRLGIEGMTENRLLRLVVMPFGIGRPPG